jgi:hypothetical protein
MPKKLNYTPTEDELVVVRRAITSDTRPEVRHRATAMQLLHQGMKPEVVADALAVSVGAPSTSGMPDGVKTGWMAWRISPGQVRPPKPMRATGRESRKC